ncbi:MAG: carbohydrate ABC transporter permease [Spirochaeta sp.]
MAFPVFFSVGLSFTDYNIYTGEITPVGLSHYLEMFTDPIFWRALRNNLFVVGVSVFGQIPLGFILAYILYRRLVRFTSFFESVVFLPMMISTVIVGLLWRHIILSPRSVLNNIIRAVTGNPDFLLQFNVSPLMAMIPVGVVMLWIYTGFYMLVFFANLQRIENSLLESAMIDGAKESQIFRKIIVPMMSGPIIVTSILAISGSLKGFDLIWAMTGGGPANFTTVLPIYMYRYAWEFGQYGYGSAASTIIVILSIILIVAFRYINRKMSGEV